MKKNNGVTCKILSTLTSLMCAPVMAESNAVYYKRLMDVGTNLVLTLSFLIAFLFFVFVVIYYSRNLVNKDMVAKNDLKPMNFAKFIMGILLVVIVARPLNSMNFINDITGMVNSEQGVTMCLVADVTGNKEGWVSNANSCLTKLNKAAADYGKMTDSKRLQSINLGLVFGIVQIIMLLFFLTSGVFIFMHILGVRNVKVTVSKAVISMIISSILMATPNMIDYIIDIRGGSNAIITP